jgi:hypothetical protein
MASRKEKPAPDPRIGSLVRFYDEGWRHGYLEKVEKGSAFVRAIAGSGLASRLSKVDDDGIEVIPPKGEDHVETKVPKNAPDSLA